MPTIPKPPKPAEYEIHHDAHDAWFEAMNGPRPGIKVERVSVPRVFGELRKPAPKEIPSSWSI